LVVGKEENKRWGGGKNKEARKRGMAILWARGQFTAQCLENVVTLKGVDYAMTGQCVGKLGLKKKHIKYIYI